MLLPAGPCFLSNIYYCVSMGLLDATASFNFAVLSFTRHEHVSGSLFMWFKSERGNNASVLIRMNFESQHIIARLLTSLMNKPHLKRNVDLYFTLQSSFLLLSPSIFILMPSSNDTIIKKEIAEKKK